MWIIRALVWLFYAATTVMLAEHLWLWWHHHGAQQRSWLTAVDDRVHFSSLLRERSDTKV